MNYEFLWRKNEKNLNKIWKIENWKKDWSSRKMTEKLFKIKYNSMDIIKYVMILENKLKIEMEGSFPKHRWD